MNNSTTNAYVFDPATKVATLTVTQNDKTAPSAAIGNATANVAGVVGNANSTASSNGLGGNVTASTTRGDATANITGRVRAGNAFGASAGDVTVTAGGANEVTTVGTNTWTNAPGFAGDARTAPGALPVQTSGTTTTTTTALGGKATILVDTSAALKAAGVGNQANGNASNSVEGTASATGLAGAKVTVTAGSSVGRSAMATSTGTKVVNKTDVTPGAKPSSVQVVTTTQLGTTADIVNDGTIGTTGFGDQVNATGTTTATVTNSATGRINGTVTAGSLRVNSVATTTDNDVNNLDPATRTKVFTTVFTAVGGASKVTNAGTITTGNGNIGAAAVNVWGSTGQVDNTGNIVGTINFGSTSNDRTEVTTQTSTATTGPVRTANANLFKQTYTLNQNGISGGVNVGGATEFTPTLKTSDITATLNLNDKSVTLGSIVAQQSAGQFGSNATFLTTTTVNLNAAANSTSFLGLDFYSNPSPGVLPINTGNTPSGTVPANTAPIFPVRNPEAVFTNAQGTLFGLGQTQGSLTGGSINAGIGVRILGVTAVNKTGAGTSVIVGTPYNPAALARWGSTPGRWTSAPSISGPQRPAAANCS